MRHAAPTPPVAARPAPLPARLAALPPSARPSLLAAEAAHARAALAEREAWAPGWRAAHTLALRLSVLDLSQRMRDGASPADVAAYVQGAGRVQCALSHMVEDAAHAGTFGEAVFSILAD